MLFLQQPPFCLHYQLIKAAERWRDRVNSRAEPSAAIRARTLALPPQRCYRWSGNVSSNDASWVTPWLPATGCYRRERCGVSVTSAFKQRENVRDAWLRCESDTVCGVLRRRRDSCRVFVLPSVASSSSTFASRPAECWETSPERKLKGHGPGANKVSPTNYRTSSTFWSHKTVGIIFILYDVS